jgi:hypothetical protein
MIFGSITVRLLTHGYFLYRSSRGVRNFRQKAGLTNLLTLSQNRVTVKPTAKLLIAVATTLLAGCQHPRVPQERWFGSYGKFLPPRDNEIEFCVTGDVNHAGILWVKDGTTIDSIEEMIKPESAKQSRTAWLTIYRRAPDGRVHRRAYNLLKKANREKASKQLQHGDILNFWYGSQPVYSGNLVRPNPTSLFLKRVGSYFCSIQPFRSPLHGSFERFTCQLPIPCK